MIEALDRQGHTAIKICGIRSATQAEALVGLGVDMIGINFWPGSKRFLAPAEGEDWLPELRYRTTLVGLFVDADVEDIVAHFDNELFAVAQLHGNESPDYCCELADREIPFIKALGVGKTSDLGSLDRFHTDYLLLDKAQDGHGGGGTRFDWKIAAGIIEGRSDKRFLLAGGINPDNVSEAIDIARPAAVDVASGVESAPGVKDLGLVEALVRRVREADKRFS